MAKYRKGKLIGAGSFGEVYEAIVEDGGPPCAIKQLQRNATEEDRRRFLREVRILASLRHKHIVRVLGSRLDDDPPWFVMPRAISNLRDKISATGSESQVWVVQEVAKGLLHAHDNGVIHRDLKPENILFFRDKDSTYAAVGDFGLGRLLTRDSTTLTQTAIGMGTVPYIAPEQAVNAKRATQLCDVYALGKILFEVLTGDIPYPRMDFSKVPRKFAYIIQKACEEEPNRRFQSMKEFLNELELILHADKLFTKPAEEARNEIQRLMEKGNFSAAAVAGLARIVVENTDDNVILTELLPRLPDPILQSFLEHHMSLILQILKAYDRAVSGSLSFEYCDVVADFYEKVFRWTESDELKCLVIRRLPLLGHSHNRFHVGVVFGRLVASLSDPVLIMAARDVLREDREVAAWCKEYLAGLSVPSMIRSVFKRSTSS